MQKSSFGLRGLVAALAIAAGSGDAFTQRPSIFERVARVTGKGPDLSWAGIRRRKPWGGSVKRHARAMAKARRSKGGRA